MIKIKKSSISASSALFLFFFLFFSLIVGAKNIEGSTNYEEKIVEKNANKAVAIKIVKSTFKQEVADLQAPEGWTFLILETQWENIHPKQKVEKKKLEGKTDRTMGVSTFAGGKKKKKTEYVMADVAYMVEEMFNHAYLVADGLAFPLHRITEEIPEGIKLYEPFTIAKKGEVRRADLVYLIPAGAANLGFQFFDYEYGNILLQLKGDLTKARGSDQPPGKVLGTIKNEYVQIAAHSLDFRRSYNEEEAPEGWQFAVVKLSGKSFSGKDIKKNIVQINPTEYTWVTTEGGYLYYCVAGSTTDEGLIRFTPEIYEYQELAFLVPFSAKVYRLGVRIKNDVLNLDLTQDKPPARPEAIANHQDGETMEVMIFGLRQKRDQVILNMGIQSLAKSGLEIQMADQFILNADGQKIYVDEESTSAITHRPPEPFIIPPGMFVRFELAFETNKAPTSLYFRGYESEAILKPLK
ncbi:MAG: hypothetical protein ACE5GI_03810 [Candidatus Aminicenantales bacterium]